MAIIVHDKSGHSFMDKTWECQGNVIVAPSSAFGVYQIGEHIPDMAIGKSKYCFRHGDQCSKSR